MRRYCSPTTLAIFLLLGSLAALGVLAATASADADASRVASVTAASAAGAAPAAGQQSFFPYEVHKRTLDNGLDVVVIPTPEFADVLSYNTLVLAGARNEVEEGKSGLAHLFEHILFRHRMGGEEGGYSAIIDRMGAFNNAWTNFDVTFYHPLTFTENLDELVRAEADRFARLDFTEEIFKTEAGAVLGEYRRIASDPSLPMTEVELRLLYGDHSYGHTTIGYLDDVQDMPNEFAAAQRFYSDYYRPNNVVVIVTGDVDPERIFALAQQHYAGWEPKPTPEIPEPAAVGGPEREHVAWEADVPPRLVYTYRLPPHRTGSVETAVGQLLPELLTSETAPLYQKLRFEKQVAASLDTGTGNYESFDSRPLELEAVLFEDRFEERGPALFDEVVADMETAFEELKSFSSRPGAAELLDELKRKYRYDMLAILSSPGDIAEQFAWYYRFERDPRVFDELVASVEALEPEDIDRFAREHFIPDKRVVVTLSTGEAGSAAEGETAGTSGTQGTNGTNGGVSAGPAEDGEPPAVQVVTLDSPSPLLTVRLMVRAGSAHDPAGKEGLAALTARGVLEGGFGDPEDPVTKEELAELTRPWGARAKPGVFLAKEVVTFEFTFPREELDRYVEEVLSPLLTRPLFDASEIERLREEGITQIRQLRSESNEMVGLEALDNFIHAGTSYGHTVAGSIEGIRGLEPADVEAFYAARYRPENMILGVSSTDEDVIATLRGALAGVGEAGSASTDADAAVAETGGDVAPPPPLDGRELAIVGMPNAGATGIHMGFPLELTRADADWWPLYIANIHFGTHRDSHGHLYQEIREKRGYNYGDYSYIEHFAFRPFALFPPFNTPRRYQYFSIWIRPVAHDYAHHLTKAAVWELERLIDEGLTEAEVERSKNKARVLYLNLAENTSRLLEAKLDDAFYGMDPGYLEGYLERIDAVTAEQVNAAIREHLQVKDLKMVIVTEPDLTDGLAANIAAGVEARGKTLADYGVEVPEEGVEAATISNDLRRIVERDEAWTAYPLGLEPDDIRLVTVDQLFQTGAFIAEPAAGTASDPER